MIRLIEGFRWSGLSGRRRRDGLLGARVPGSVKMLTVAQLMSLSEAARVSGCTAIGRPSWVSSHRDEIKAVVLLPLGVASSGEGYHSHWRCYAGLAVERTGVIAFTIDISQDDYRKLPIVRDAWDLASSLLNWAEMIAVE